MKKFALVLSASLFLFAIGNKISSNAKENEYSTFIKTKGWRGGGDKNEYEMKFDDKVKYKGKKSVYVKSKTDKIKSDFTGIVQSIDPKKYLGKRVKYSGFVKTKNVENVSLWMRVDGPNEKTLSFDNMHDRYIKGTNDWKEYEIILDVPSNSIGISLGGFLAGKGEAWFDSFNIEIIGDLPKEEKERITEFLNLDFEE